MNFKELNKGKSIDEKFEEYDTQNPTVYQNFETQVMRAIQKGRKKLSAKSIIGYLRWNMFIEKHQEGEYKINDAYTSRYARKFIKINPDHQEIFEIRGLRS